MTLSMRSNMHQRSGAFLALFGACMCGVSAESISPRLADSPPAQRDRDLTLIGGSRIAPAEREALLKRLRALKDELRARLLAIDGRLREKSESESSLTLLKAEREKVLQNEKKVEELIARLENASDGR